MVLIDGGAPVHMPALQMSADAGAYMLVQCH